MPHAQRYSMVFVRQEKPDDAAAIRHVIEQAFGRASEADLVDALRWRCVFTLSLVAVLDEQVVGHVLFTPVTIESDRSSFNAIGLGPMGGLPTHQQNGIGSHLVRDGLEECRRAGHEVVVVLGHPHFYPRFGFEPARRYGIRYEDDVPDEVFMVTELRSGALAGRSGTVRYQPEFRSV